jgi:NADPH-dependent 7-cyano-7-deazaguanine reductase QueF
MSVDSGLWYSYSEQPGVRRNSLVHVGTALRISEQPDVCRNSLTYVGTAWCMSEQPDVCRNSLTYIGTTSCMSEQPDVFWNSRTYIGTAWCMSEQPDVYRNSLMYVGTAWCMSEQPDIYRYSLMYVGTAWHMSFRSVLKISGRVCTHMVYMILALNKTFQILIISAWLQLLFNIYCTIFMKCYSCIPVYLYICHLTMSVFTDQVFSMFCLSYFFFQFVMI